MYLLLAFSLLFVSFLGTNIQTFLITQINCLLFFFSGIKGMQERHFPDNEKMQEIAF